MPPEEAKKIKISLIEEINVSSPETVKVLSVIPAPY